MSHNPMFTGTGHSPTPNVTSATTVGNKSTADLESLLTAAGIDFEVIHEGSGGSCHACPEGLGLAA